MLGIALYKTANFKINKSKQYLQIAKECGFKLAFFSLHMPEQKVDQEWIKLIKYAKEIGYIITCDISSKYYSNELIKEIHPERLRLDFGFSMSQIIDINNQFKDIIIELNGSDNTINNISNIIKSLPDINFAISYNFYPKQYTGMDINTFKTRTKIFSEWGLNTTSFVSNISSKFRRGPIFAGLPTIEKFRNIDCISQLQWYKVNSINDVILADITYDIKLLKKISDTYHAEYLSIFVNTHIWNLLPHEIKKSVLTVRNDINSYVIRFNETRGLLLNNKPIKPLNNNKQEFKPLSIIIDNINYGRYNGEIYITLQNIPANINSNYLGTIKDQTIVIDNLKATQKIKFILNSEK